MAVVYYAKFNINSNLEELKKDKGNLEELLSTFANEIDTKHNVYKFIQENEYTISQDEVDEDGNEVKKKVTEIETYRFIKIKRLKEKHGNIIMGELMREKPDSIKIYNNDTHDIESTGINARAYSTSFLFDLKSETIAFTERLGIGRNQFIKAFEELSKAILKDQAVKVILKQNARNFVEQVKELSRVNQIDIEIISPNFVDKELSEIEEEAKKIGEEMDEQNITKMQYYLETSAENDKGIDIEGKYAQETLHKYSIMSVLGYAKAVITGFVGKSPKTIKSEKDAPLVTTISYEDRENEINFKEHVLNAIEREAIKRTIKKQNANKNIKGENGIV